MERRYGWLGITSLGALLLTGGGCAGTSPNLSVPQMQTPTLNGGNLANRSVTGLPPGAAAEASLPALEPVKTPEGTFVQLPYLQLGDHPKLLAKEALDLRWLAPADTKTESWSVELKPSTATTGWKKLTGKLTTQAISVAGVEPHVVVTAPLTDLKPGALFDYQILKDDKPVFAGRARARRSAKEAQRFVVFGDCAQGTEGQKKVAFQTALARPDFIFITGDIVYGKGKASEYATKFWPVYNAAEAKAELGAPLLSAIPFIATPGNHDIRSAALEKEPDAFAYFYYWDQPLNGPALATTASAPGLNDADKKALLAAYPKTYPTMANFSYDYGNAHWTVLDANPNVVWTSPELRAWVENDLKSAQKATWRFVAFHHPPFSSTKEHFNDQWMRSLADLFEKYGVSVVWSGHVHNYQRSYPLSFKLTKPRAENGAVEGTITLDKAYDGVKNTKAKAPIYIVTGAGGAELYKNIEGGKVQDFTAKYIDDIHSLTVVDINDKKMTVKQINADGKELDSWILTK